MAADPTQGEQHVRSFIALEFADLVHVSLSASEVMTDSTGTTVLIPDLGANPPIGLGGNGPVDRLTARFALALQKFAAPTAAGPFPRPQYLPGMFATAVVRPR